MGVGDNAGNLITKRDAVPDLVPALTTPMAHRGEQRVRGGGGRVPAGRTANLDWGQDGGEGSQRREEARASPVVRGITHGQRQHPVEQLVFHLLLHLEDPVCGCCSGGCRWWSDGGRSR